MKYCTLFSVPYFTLVWFLDMQVSLRSPEDHVSQLSGSISSLLPHLERPLVLEREITTEFLVGTTIGGGPCSSPKERFGKFYHKHRPVTIKEDKTVI